MAKSKDFLKGFLEQYSDYVVTDEMYGDVRAISTGSLSLDYCTGIGGIPIGKFTEIYGPESVGKTTICLSIARNVILSGKKVLYIDAEHGLDYNYIRMIAPEATEENFILLQTDLSDDAFTASEQAIASGEFGCIFLDSLANLVSKRERANEFEKDTMGVIPKDLAKFLRRNSHAIRNTETAFVFVNQVRDKIGAYVPTLESPGGHALRHMCSLRISLASTGSKATRITVGDEEIGILTTFSIKKNKLARPFKSHFIPILWGIGIDRTRDIVELAEVIGVINKAGAYYRFEGENIGQGLGKTLEFLNQNKEVLDKVVEACYTIMRNERTKELQDLLPEVAEEL